MSHTQTDLTTDALCASGQVRALEWTQGTRKDDRTAHCECGTFSVGSNDNGGWFAILRHITPDQQCLDLEIGWSDNRALAMDDCEHERRSRILAALTPAQQPEVATPTAQEAVRGLRVHMASTSFEDQEDMPDEPGVLLVGSVEAVKAAAKMLGDEVTLYAHPPQPSVSVAEAGDDLVRAMRLFWEADDAADECRAAGKDLEAARYDKMATSRWQSIPEKIDALDAALCALKGEDHG